jgi:hypothetical protein
MEDNLKITEDDLKRRKKEDNLKKNEKNGRRTKRIKWRTTQSTKINRIDCDTIVNSPNSGTHISSKRFPQVNILHLHKAALKLFAFYPAQVIRSSRGEGE